jgi:hypothetical protein
MERAGGRRPHGFDIPYNKAPLVLSRFGRRSLGFPLSSHHGGGEEEAILGSVVFGGSAERRSGADGFPRAQHMATVVVAVTFGQKGGPSSTSMAEAYSSIHRWSSTLLGCQVVRSRNPGNGQRLGFVVGGELPSMLLSKLGGNAWSSPVNGARGALVLYCLFSFLARVFFKKWRLYL